MRCTHLAAMSALLTWISAEPASAYTVTLNPGGSHSAVNLQTRDGAGTAASDTQLFVPEPSSALLLAAGLLALAARARIL